MSTLAIYKVVSHADYQIYLKTGFIPDQPADILTPDYIHACDLKTISSIISKFYGTQPDSVVVIPLSHDRLITEGFIPVWEQNRPEGPFYWHLYRDNKRLISNFSEEHV